MSDLDNIDRNILSQLLKHGRTTTENLSKKVGLSKSPVTSPITRMEAKRVIR
ncbi:MAG: winged helix-turn-helix transcriptional regulator, partial [Hyphomicrobiales bacterium]|nr:winged helix-turn-helix transcriptional regulator [Hyphomicrobiales bacterium]